MPDCCTEKGRLYRGGVIEKLLFRLHSLGLTPSTLFPVSGVGSGFRASGWRSLGLSVRNVHPLFEARLFGDHAPIKTTALPASEH